MKGGRKQWKREGVEVLGWTVGEFQRDNSVEEVNMTGKERSWVGDQVDFGFWIMIVLFLRFLGAPFLFFLVFDGRYGEMWRVITMN